MNRLHRTAATQAFPQLQQLHVFSAANRGFVADYLTHLRARHYAPSTLVAIIGALKRFALLIPAPRQTQLVEDLTQITPEDIDAWLQAASERGLAPSTMDTQLRIVQRFFAFLHEQGRLVQQPIRPRRHQVLVPQSLPRPMEEADLRAFFRVIDALRDRTLFLLMLRCGLRVGEVSTLRWLAIDLERGAIRIDNGKGQVDRVVYLAPDVDKSLRQWRGLQPQEAQYVFPSRYKPGLPLTVRHIQYRMATYLQQAQIPQAYSPHSLRHSFATELLNAGASLEVVKELMGQRTIDMTLRYARLYDRTKRAQYDQAMAQVEKRQGF